MTRHTKESWLENPPDDWEECGCCGGYHPPEFDGDCRQDDARWPHESTWDAHGATIAKVTGENEGEADHD